MIDGLIETETTNEQQARGLKGLVVLLRQRLSGRIGGWRIEQCFQQLIERGSGGKVCPQHGIGGDADKHGMTVYDDEIQGDKPKALVALAGIRAVGRVRFEKLFLRGFTVVILALSAFVGTGTVVAESQHMFAEVLVKMPKIAWPNDGIKIQQGSLSAVFMEYLHL